MTDRIRLIKHEAVPGCGSFEVRLPDGRPRNIFISTRCGAVGCGLNS